MKVAVVTAPGQVELREETTPTLGPDQLLIEVGACGLCTMERRLFSGEKAIYPVAPGHEVAGRVAEAGSVAAQLDGVPQVGDTVAVDLLTRCGACRNCRRGRTALCKHPQGGTLGDGTISMGAGLADYVVVAAKQAWRTGDAPIDHASMCEPLACVAHSVRLSGLVAGDRVAVLGAGFMGRLHLALAQHRGAESVGLVDVSADRRSEASDAGASWTSTPDDARSTGGPQDIVFVTAGVPGALDTAVGLLGDGGRVVLFGAFPKDLAPAVPADYLHHHELSILGVYSHEPADWREASSLLASGALRAQLEPLVTARFVLTDVAKAFELAAATPVYRVLVGG